MDLLAHFPYSEPRAIQKEALRLLGDAWDDYDIFVISAPTAFGKTALAKTLMRALGSVSCITPSNLLVDQFREEFEDTPTLSRMDSYFCEEYQVPCSRTRAQKKGFCKGCDCGKALATAKYRRGPGVYTYHMYLAQKLQRRVLVVDEAHNLLPHIRERQSLRLWKHDWGFPQQRGRLEEWLQKLPQNKKRVKLIEALSDALLSRCPQWTIQYATEEFGGKGTQRGRPEDRPCLKLLPVDVRDAPPIFWPGLGKPEGTEKLVLLSATISRKDVQALGLDRKRVLYLGCESPIPASHRPVIFIPVSHVSRATHDPATQAIGEFIRDHVLPEHPGQKGIIHATYKQAPILFDILSRASVPNSGVPSRPVLSHDRSSRARVYRQFRDASPESGAVLIACGMYEGIDLEGDAGRWQCVAKVPWPNLGDPSVLWQEQQDPEWFSWETWKLLIQACGRICRTPRDKGVSLILDSSFGRLLREVEGNKDAGTGLVPEWFLDGLTEGRSLLNV